MQDSLRVIAGFAHQLKCLTAPRLREPTSIQFEITGLAEELTQPTAPRLTSQLDAMPIQFEVAPLNLRCPFSFQRRFEAFGICDGVVSELTHIVAQHAEDLRKICVAKFEESCYKLMAIRQPSRCLPEMIEKLRSTYQNIYEQLLMEWDERIPALLDGIAMSTSRSDCVEKASLGSKVSKFNHVSSLPFYSLWELLILGV
jgi:hypothetical protein